MHEVPNTTNWPPTAESIDVEDTKVPDLLYRFLSCLLYEEEIDAVDSVEGCMRLSEPMNRKVMSVGKTSCTSYPKAECIHQSMCCCPGQSKI